MATESEPIGTMQKARTATQSRGREQVARILHDAQLLLVGEGYASLTLRRIARNLDISLGNLTYYFPTKDALLEALVTDNIKRHQQAMREQQAALPKDPKERCRAYINNLIDECRKPEVRGFFYQIWGMATHDQNVRRHRDQIYAAFRSEAEDLIAPLRPDLGAGELTNLVAALISFIEGLHVIFDLSPDVLGDGPEQESDLGKRLFNMIVQ